jgi:hypothetical protein
MNHRILLACIGLAGCFGGQPEAPAPPPAAPPRAPVVNRPGPGRKVMVQMTPGGFDPARVEANPGESLTLLFDRAEGGCPGEVVVPADGRRVAVAPGAVGELTVTAPVEGELVFECGDPPQRGVVAIARP